MGSPQSPIPPGQRALTAIPDLLPGKSTSITFAFKPNQTFTLVAIANPTSQTRNGTSFDLLVKLSDLQMVMSDSRPTEPKPDTIALWKDLVFPDQENTVRLISHSVVHYNGKLLSVAELSIELTQRIEKGNFDTLTIVAPPSIELSSFAAIVQLCTDVHIPHINVRTEDPAPLIKTQRH